MRKIILVCIGSILISFISFSQYKLEIQISEIRNDKGNIMLQLFDDNEQVILQEISPVKDKKSTFILKDLKAGIYAVRYYHDENLNGQMDTNMFGKPTEGYGFSNNVMGQNGPPPFEKWLFEINSDKNISLKPTY